MLGATQVGGSALSPLPAVELLTSVGCFPELTAQALELILVDFCFLSTVALEGSKCPSMSNSTEEASAHAEKQAQGTEQFVGSPTFGLS